MSEQTPQMQLSLWDTRATLSGGNIADSNNMFLVGSNYSIYVDCIQYTHYF